MTPWHISYPNRSDAATPRSSLTAAACTSPSAASAKAKKEAKEREKSSPEAGEAAKAGPPACLLSCLHPSVFPSGKPARLFGSAHQRRRPDPAGHADYHRIINRMRSCCKTPRRAQGGNSERPLSGVGAGRGDGHVAACLRYASRRPHHSRTCRGKKQRCLCSQHSSRQPLKKKAGACGLRAAAKD